MTEKLYEQDSMLKSCLATVLSCAEDKLRVCRGSGQDGIFSGGRRSAE